MQGRASLQPPVADYPSTVIDHWERLEPWRDLGPLWRRWLRVYALRVEIRIAVERVLVWPDLACQGTPDVEGAPSPTQAPASQEPPAKGTAPRVDSVRVARRAARLPHALLGWAGADGLPLAVPVRVGAADARGIRLEAPPGTVPPGARRAGLTAHWFSHGVVGQRQTICTGWMEAGDPTGNLVRYSPHTQAFYRMPASRLIYRMATGGVTRPRYRKAPPAGKTDAGAP